MDPYHDQLTTPLQLDYKVDKGLVTAEIWIQLLMVNFVIVNLSHSGSLFKFLNHLAFTKIVFDFSTPQIYL